MPLTSETTEPTVDLPNERDHPDQGGSRGGARRIEVGRRERRKRHHAHPATRRPSQPDPQLQRRPNGPASSDSYRPQPRGPRDPPSHPNQLRSSPGPRPWMRTLDRHFSSTRRCSAPLLRRRSTGQRGEHRTLAVSSVLLRGPHDRFHSPASPMRGSPSHSKPSSCSAWISRPTIGALSIPVSARSPYDVWAFYDGQLPTTYGEYEVRWYSSQKRGEYYELRRAWSVLDADTPKTWRRRAHAPSGLGRPVITRRLWQVGHRVSSSATSVTVLNLTSVPDEEPSWA